MFQLRLGRWEEVLADVAACDTLITDTPYSAKTHTGHDRGRQHDRAARKRLSYRAWGEPEVRRFVAHWAPRTRGWFVTITDHVLAPLWSLALEQLGRYVFAPLPFVAPGSRVRRQGDGPALWAVQIVVARPRCAPWCRWGALPGAYVLPKGEARAALIGGKPPWLMRQLVADYSRPGELVVDPCAGAATTLIEADKLGRQALGAEMSARAFARAREVWRNNNQGVRDASRRR